MGGADRSNTFSTAFALPARRRRATSYRRRRQKAEQLPSTGSFRLVPAAGFQVTPLATMSAQGDDDVVDTSVVIKQSTAAVPVRQGWQTGLFACDDDGCDAFCCSAWFPCLAFASIADIVDQGSESQCLYCGCYLVAAYFGCWWAYAGWYRGKLREQYGLPETPMPDWLTHLLCHWCALAQEYRELAKRGFDVDDGWNGRPRPAATSVPRVQVPMTRS